MRAGVRLGIDVGEARIGVARTDPGAMLATPLETVSRTWPGGSTDLDRIVALTDEFDAVEVLVGLPISLSGQEGPAAGRAREFAGALAKSLAEARAAAPVRLVDERLTTVSAHQFLHKSGVPGKKRRNVIDQAAAVVLLQAAVDAERQTGRPPGETVRVGE